MKKILTLLNILLTLFGLFLVSCNGIYTENTPQLEDHYEENDTLATAYTLPANTALSTLFGDGINNPGDEDWYKMNVSGDKGLQIHITMEITYNPGTDTVQFNFNDSFSYLIVGTGFSEVRKLLAIETLPAAGIYYIQVHHLTGNTRVKYNLLWYCTATPADDNYEENNTKQSAYTLPANTTLSTISGIGILNPGDTDYYKLNISSSNGLQINIPLEVIAFSGSDSFIFGLVDISGNYISQMSIENLGKYILKCQVLASGIYYLNIHSSSDVSAEYDLIWYCTN